ncbi:YceI family protein [Cellulophaga baltica]|uniref:YceI family protein n=1 Tax=Cellulophaga TaxID=104264 RepID=UPI001C068345|nr:MULTISPECIES: YceI family protein [Cellulophaga]MBU2996661.1 YceI family protein [Cellulophaga baltica]MDO6768055.1 YceI family protein [Cellulophaga sp. 1_MG-2023]
MKTQNKRTITRVLSLFAFIVFTSNFIQAQEFSLTNNESSLKVYGTSNLHDWHIDAEEQSGVIKFKNLKTAVIEKCNLKVTVKSLKSGKNGMDKNTFKALNSDSYSYITFNLTNIKNSIDNGDGTFQVKSLGDLTISGVKKQIGLDFLVTISQGKIMLTGEKTLNMTHYKIEPPKALLGTITTGEEVTIKFSSTFK